MGEWKPLAVMVIIGGIALIIFGLILLTIGKLPGDIVIRRGNFTFFFPIVTSIVLSLVLTLVLYLFMRR